MIKFIKNHFYILVIVILGLTPLLWFKGNVIMVGHDNVFPLSPDAFLQGRLFTWSNLDLGQNQSLIMGTALIHFIDSIPHFLGFSLQADQKLVYIFWFLGMLIAPFVLAKELNKDSKTFHFLASILYAFNFFILQGWFIGERTKFSAYIALPLILTVFLRVYKNKTSVFRGALWNALILFVFNAGGLYGIPLYGGLYISIICFLLYFSLCSYLEKDFAKIKKFLFLLALTLASFLVVNAYYILPMTQQVLSQYNKGITNTGGINGLVDWASEISANTGYGNLIRLQGIPDWYDNPDRPYSASFLSNPVLIAASYIWPIIILGSLFLIKDRNKRKYIFYFFLVFLVGILFAAGTHPPLGFIYTFFIQAVPGFVIFRTPYYKFAPAIFLASSFLIAYAFDALRGKLRKILVPVFVVFILLYHFPFFTGNFFSFKPGFSTRNSIPSYVFDFGKWGQSKKDNGRILLLPQNNGSWQYDIYNWGFLSLQLLPTEVVNKDILANDDKLSDNERHLVLSLYNALSAGDVENIKKFSYMLNVKYLLVRNDVDYSLSWATTIPPSVYINNIEEILHIKPIQKFGQWIVYDLGSDESLLFASDKLNVIDSSLVDASEKFIEFSKSSEHFVVKDNKNNAVLAKINPSLTSIYENPQCITCSRIQTSVLTLPDRVILPDSPFYPLILLREKEDSRKITGKSAIYDDIGLSLKRVAELQQIFLQNNFDKYIPDAFDRYIALLTNIDSNYSSLTDFKDKFETAMDINFYLNGEIPLITDLPFDENSTQKLLQIFDLVSSIKKKISPYLFQDDPLQKRVYQLLIEKPGIYMLYSERKGFENAIKNKQDIEVGLDNQMKGVKIDPTGSDWIPLGSYQLSSGQHVLSLKMPALTNLASMAKNDSGVGVIPNTSCFSSHADNYSDNNSYRVKFSVPKELLNSLHFFIRREQKGKMVVDKMEKFGTFYGSDNYEAKISSKDDTQNVWLIFCSNLLSQDMISNVLKPSINEIADPRLFLVAEQKVQTNNPIVFIKKSPTEYMVEFNNNSPIFLGFLERYDSGWTLQGFDNNHFSIDGYANGWYIDTLGHHKLRLVYMPQKWFKTGELISFISIISILYYLFFTRKKYEQ